MKRLQAYKFELMPNGAQVRAMRQYAGACRFVYNKALAWQNAQYQADNTFKFSYTKIANLLPQWKAELDVNVRKNSQLFHLNDLLFNQK